MFAWQLGQAKSFDETALVELIGTNNGAGENLVSGVFLHLNNGILATRNPETQEPINGTHVFFWGRIDNISALTKKLNPPVANSTIEMLIYLAWQEYGDGFPKHIMGNFSIALVNFETNWALLVKDPLGTKPLYYSKTTNAFACATSIPALQELPNISREKNVAWVKHFAVDCYFATDFTQTAYQHIHKVAPGHIVEISHEEIVANHRYMEWQDDAPYARARDNKWAIRHRNLLEKAISRRVGSNSPICIENSGGLDSGSIITLLADNHENPLVSVSTIYADLEKELIDLLNAAAGAKQAYLREGHKIDEIERIEQGVNILGHPSTQSMEIGLDLLQNAIADTGITSVFSGFGGDQVVTNMAEERSIEMVDNFEYVKLWTFIGGHILKRPYRLLKMIWNKGRHPRLDAFVGEVTDENFNFSALKSEFLSDAEFTGPLAEKSNSRISSYTVNQTIINFHLRDSHIPDRFDSHTLMADSIGLEYHWPLWDTELVQNYLSTPGIEKMGPKHDRRYLHRCAVSDLVPDKVLNANSKFTGARIMSIADLDKRRQDWDSIARDLLENIHPELRTLLDMAKFDAMRRRAIDVVGKEYDISDNYIVATFSNIYALDFWYKKETAMQESN